MVEEEGGCELAHDSSSIRVYRLSDAKNALGGRTGLVAIKVLVDEQPDPHRLARLNNEYVLSRRPLLSRCGAVRTALRHAKHDGLHAIFLEWATGITLKEWRQSVYHTNINLSSMSLDDSNTIRSLLRLSWMISGSLAEIHEAGVVHNDLSSDNIIVDTHVGENKGENREGERLEFSIKVIDLGSAALLKESDPSASIRAKAKDLVSLGLVLFELFCGRDNLRCSQDECNSNSERRKDTCKVDTPMLHEKHERLISSGIPLSVSILVSKLMGLGDFYQYQSAREVQTDLHQILDYPERFLVDANRDIENGVLHFSTERLYGRMMEVSMLLSAYSRVIASRGKPEMVLVCGNSGTGKSSLVRQVREPVVRRGGYFLCGKFDSLRQAEPLSAVVAAFTEYCKQIMEVDPGIRSQVRATILEKIGEDGISVLINLIPSLRNVIVGVPVLAALKVGGKEAQNRLKHMFRLFVRAIASISHPLVLFLDDLQWADSASLDLIRTLVTDNESKFFLFIGCYRDNEVNGSHPLLLQLGEMASLNVPITTIKIENISKDAMNHMISDALRSLRSLTKSLTDAVYYKTNGNAFFAIEFLKSLWEEGSLTFSHTSGSWQWERMGTQSKNAADTAFELVSQNILKLPAEVRGALQVAACLGHHCDESILCLIADEAITEAKLQDTNGNVLERSKQKDYLAHMLDRAADQGLVEKATSSYKFVHDQVQHAAYISIPECERGMLHLKIGKRIWKKSSAAKLEEVLFTAVDQIYLGSTFVDPAEKMDLAKLYLRAGKKAMSSSLFLPAATYLKAGTNLLGPGHWDDEYELSLQLFEALAEADFFNGNFNKMRQTLDEIFVNARCFEDKLGAYRTMVNALGAQDKVQDAIKTGLLVLQELGESFPDSEDAEVILWSEWLRTKDLLEEFTDETLVTMEITEDRLKIAVMEFLKVMVMYTYMANQEYLPLVIMRMMQLSLRNGVCKESAFGFTMYGVISCGFFGDISRGYQFGQIALRLLERFDRKDCAAQVYAAMYGNIAHWKEHSRLSLEPLLHGHRVGIMFGDIEYAMVNARIYCLVSFQCGMELAPLEKEMCLFCEKMVQHKQLNFLAILSITRQAVQNLMGLSDNPLQLTGEAMDQDQMLENAIEKNNSLIACCIYYHRMWLAYYFGDYMSAAELGKKSRNVDKLCTSELVVSNHAFYYGLTALALARETKESTWRSVAKEELERMKNWAAHAPCNFQHKVALLEAESAFLSEANIPAEKYYDVAIALAFENGFIHEQALANEKAAMFHFEVGNKARSSYYYDQAHDLYLEWGAQAKAVHLRTRSD